MVGRRGLARPLQLWQQSRDFKALRAQICHKIARRRINTYTVSKDCAFARKWVGPQPFQVTPDFEFSEGNVDPTVAAASDLRRRPIDLALGVEDRVDPPSPGGPVRRGPVGRARFCGVHPGQRARRRRARVGRGGHCLLQRAPPAAVPPHEKSHRRGERARRDCRTYVRLLSRLTWGQGSLRFRTPAAVAHS